MLEIIRHAIGMCPDHMCHPNLLAMLVTFGGLLPLGWWRIRHVKLDIPARPDKMNRGQRS